MKYILLTTIFIVSLASQLHGQNQQGTVTGTVVDSESGEVLLGANVYIQVPDSNPIGVSVDISGKYNLKLAPGTYEIIYSFVTYQTKRVQDVVIEAGQVVQLDVALSSEGVELNEVVVSAGSIDNDEVSLLMIQKRSLPVQDGISAQEINRVGFSNSAESMKQVTGASVEDGKFIVMRGLGDRYSISSMDGSVLPTTNPYRNSASLDLIPTSMVDNIVVKKTFSPDMPGNFTGGAVDINTKSLPDRMYVQINTSMSYNDQTTFNDRFLNDPVNSSLGRLGYDDGSRAREDMWSDNQYLTQLNRYLIDIQNNNLSDNEIEEFNSTMRSFSNRRFSVRSETPGLNHSLNVSLGNRFSIGEKQLGYNFGVNYGKSFTQYDEREINSYKSRIPDGMSDRMQAFQLNRGTESSDDVTNGLIGSLTYQWNPRNTLSVMSIYNNNATESVLDMPEGRYPGALSSGTYNNRVISFMQRQLFNSKLKGEHFVGDNLDLNWSANYIVSSQYEPNTRYIGSPVNQAGQYFFIREVQLPFHFFRDLTDTQYNAKVDLDYNLSNELSIKTGAFFSRKDRDFSEYRYQLENNGTDPGSEFISFGEASGDYDMFFSTFNTGILGKDANGNNILGLTYRDQTRPENSYIGSEQISALYLMAIYNISDRLRTFGGARVEKTDFSVESMANNDGEGTIDVIDILPSVNFIYALNENSNLRLSGSRTLARPNMRELAPFASFDLLGGFPIVGNPDLTRTNITNLDFRYETFPRAGEMFAFSVFYKDFSNPIVLELDVATDQPQYQYVNTSNGLLYGFEIELRKRLDFISPALTNFKFSTNFTYINSRVDLSKEEYETRRTLDPSIKSYRPFPYQSPYLLNLSFIYESPTSGWQGAVYANLFGPRLTANGAGAAPDVFEIYARTDRNSDGSNVLSSEVPLPDLNIRIGKDFFNGLSASFSVNNILDYSVVQYQEADNRYYTNSALNPGRNVSMSVTYVIN